MHGLKKIIKNKTYYITYIFLNLWMGIVYILVDVDNCTQGSIDGYRITALQLEIIGVLLIFILVRDIINKRIMHFTILPIQFFMCIYGFFEGLPYFLYTTLKGITLCHGCCDWGGFENRYGFAFMNPVCNFEERIIPVVFIGVAIVIFFLTIVNIIVSRKEFVKQFHFVIFKRHKNE